MSIWDDFWTVAILMLIVSIGVACALYWDQIGYINEEDDDDDDDDATHAA